MGLLRWLRRLDDRALNSRLGWLLPGGLGIFYKLGRRDRSPRERLWPYLLDPLCGWLYNSGREDALRQAARREKTGGS